MAYPTLTELANRYGSDKGTVHGDRHNYTAFYDLLFAPLRAQPITFLELGLARGGPENPGVTRPAASESPSVSMWLDYFPSASVVGFDITDFSAIRHDRFRFVQGDASRPEDLQRLAAAAEGFDVVIDDGSHASPHQQLAFKYLFPRLAPGGLYVIEDLHWQSPVFEDLVPGTPKTAAFFGACLDHGVYLPNPLLSEAEMAAVRGGLVAHAIFPSFNGAASGPKILVLRKAA
jgi:hypothetical protein